jgi:hypothetical protein
MSNTTDSWTDPNVESVLADALETVRPVSLASCDELKKGRRIRAYFDFLVSGLASKLGA